MYQVNPGRQGFYRVNYSSDLFSPLLPVLKDGSLSAQDRMGLQSDAFALVSCLSVVLYRTLSLAEPVLFLFVCLFICILFLCVC